MLKVYLLFLENLSEILFLKEQKVVSLGDNFGMHRYF